jgi:hypothetical protein
VIRRTVGPYNENKAEAETPGILNCRSYNAFWIGWRGATIAVGHGSVPNREVILQWPDEEFRPIDYVGLSSGNGAHADWEIMKGGCEYQ